VRTRRWRFVVVGLFLVGLMISPTTKAQSPITFSGQAIALRATVLGISTVIADTGPLPSSGGAQQASLLSAGVPGLLTADVLHATTVGQGDASRSRASVADLNLTVGGNTIASSLIASRAQARCAGGVPTLSGNSEIVALTVNGAPVAVSGQPNQTIALPNGALVINEQQSSTHGQAGDITVNALHVVVNGLADVLISSAHADISCPGAPVCTGDDFEVGDGEDHNPENGEREEHSVASGSKQEQDSSGQWGYWGHMEFVRGGLNPLRVHATRITRFVIVDAFTRHLEGEREVNGEPGHTFTADMTDNRTRGSRDEFRMSTDRGDTGGNELEHGDEENEEPCDQ